MFQCVYTRRGDVRHIITVHRIDEKRVKRWLNRWERRSRDPDARPFTDADGMALRIQMIRKGLSLSQAEFASQFHVPLATLKDWEQGVGNQKPRRGPV